MAPQAANHPPVSRRPMTEKHVLFGLAGETFAVELLQLREILAKYEFTVTPNLPRTFRGVLALRGEPIPVVDLRRRFGFPDGEVTDQRRVIIVDLEPNPFGIEVDQVYRVATVDPTSIEPPPALTGGGRLPFVLGVTELPDGKLAIHLDMQQILSSVEQIHLAELGPTIRDAYRTETSSDLAEPDAPEAM